MNRNICTHYIVGVSVGSMMQPTSIAILEQETRVRDSWKPYNHALRLRHLERVPMDVRYPQMIDLLAERIDALKDKEQARQTDLVVDVTGTGRSVGKLIKESGLKPIQVTITAGTDEDGDDLSGWRLAKTELVGGLQVSLQSDRLDMASELELVPTLVKELQAFKLRAPVINGSDPESWREGEYDDLVFAVGLANWRAGRNVPRRRDVHVEWRRKVANQNLSWMA
jgi:hypothetical protein